MTSAFARLCTVVALTALSLVCQDPTASAIYLATALWLGAQETKP